MRKRKPYHDLQPESDETNESDSYVEVRRQPKFIIYYFIIITLWEKENLIKFMISM